MRADVRSNCILMLGERDTAKPGGNTVSQPDGWESSPSIRGLLLAVFSHSLEQNTTGSQGEKQLESAFKLNYKTLV